MAAVALYDEILPIRRSAFKDIQVMAAIDRGLTLTKIGFVPKEAHLLDEFLPFRCLTFSNDDFEKALETLKTSAHLPKTGKLHITGHGCDCRRKRIQEVLGLDLEFVREHLTLATGAFLTIINTRSEDVFYPTAPHIKWQRNTGFVKDFLGDLESVGDDGKSFPAGILCVGSGASYSCVNEEGRCLTGDISSFCGKTFMGLAHMMIGSCDYSEIMMLAAAGDCFKLDNIGRDFGSASDAPNYYVLSDTPSFSFGKAGHPNWVPDEVSRADKASSLLSFFANGLNNEMKAVAKLQKIRRFYVTGNFVRAEVVRSKLQESNSKIPPYLDLKFVNTGHIGAIAAMLMSDPGAK